MSSKHWLAVAAAVLLPNACAMAEQVNHGRVDYVQQDGGTAPTASTDAEMQEDSEERPAGPWGGVVHPIGDLQAEVLVEPGGLRVFVYDRDGHPVDLRAARGLAALQAQSDVKRYRYDLFPEVRQDQRAQMLSVAVDLRRIAGERVDIELQLVGIPGAERRPATFAVKVVAPITEQQRAAAAIAAREVCPVSGHLLGSMGDPVPVTIGDQNVYVCCAGCVNAVKANPAKYLTEKRELEVVPSTEADAEAIALQRVCPVMDEPLGSMGPPLKVIGLGPDVFLCCRGCLMLLREEPAKYLENEPGTDNARTTTGMPAGVHMPDGQGHAVIE